jgi:16S rRNA (uracil1498-N3)-methyltransferase
MTHRLYLSEPATLLAAGATLELNREQSHYLNRVLRLKTGAELLCFDGRGTEWLATITAIDKRRCTLTLDRVVRKQIDVQPTLTLAVSWLKGAAMDTVMQKATELGADGIQVLQTEHSNVQLDEKRTTNKLQHWRQITISAAEQCGRLFVPDVGPPVTLPEFLAGSFDGRRLMLDLNAPLLDAGSQRQAMSLLIGPEGGWSDKERELAHSHDVPLVGLGGLTLRAETAPLAALAAIQHSWGWNDAPT